MLPNPHRAPARMKRVSREFLELAAFRSGRLIEFDTARNRAILRINGEQFYADVPPAGDAQAEVAS